ncbi:hypothetical protein [Metabacillus sediminilitoris]|uniref:DUF2269 domain-containing protein n=2 Tax=Metabacillus sediminilitoris TaxID=2567941 RepID=A0A4S4BXY0_9BACI|nr:hypothetical protein [Metabacillus sediminilitoris]QGQ44468.1 hypothetical protein GMB29_03860 [Metabacillus sediminilitoris]THF80091.1 hypothetical protein E6W99_10475 [Metabacillus sediminilitoris]
MIMLPSIRKLALLVHIISTVSWIGAVAVFLALSISGLNSQDNHIVRAAYLSMELTARLVIVPLSLVSLLSGLVQSLGTKWGLFHHYWVLVKFLLTLLATIVLILQLKPISYISDIASNTTLTSDNLLEARLSLVVHAGGGLLVLLAVTILSVYKPRGMTRYGWHKRNEQS